MKRRYMFVVVLRYILTVSRHHGTHVLYLGVPEEMKISARPSMVPRTTRGEHNIKHVVPNSFRLKKSSL